MRPCLPRSVSWLGCALAALSLVCTLNAGAAPGDPNTPQELLSKAEERLRSITDYRCFAEGQAILGEKRDGGSYRVWYRNPGLARIKVISGRSKGSEIAVDTKGQVRARKGGLLKPFVVKMKPDDRRLLSLRGISVCEITWPCFYRRWRESASRSGARVALASRSSREAPYEVVISFEHEGKQCREHYRIDPRLWVLTEAEMWENGQRVDQIRFSEVALDTGVEEDFFRL